MRDRLVAEFGSDQIFLDVEAIDAGSNFVEQINREVGECDALIAMIGDEWLEPGADGRRRLDDPADFVRLEIEAALARGIEVIPVLVAGAVPPTADQLPEGLAELANRQALELSDSRWEYDAGRLITRLRELGLGAGDDGGAPDAAGRRRAPAVLAAVSAVAAIAVVAVVVLAGGDDPPTPVTPDPDEAAAANVLISDLVGQTQSMPETYSFSVNGDLVGTDLEWRDWGEPSAAASGDFQVRAYPSTQMVTVAGTMLVTGFTTCGNKRYYDQATVSLTEDLPFDPPNKFDLPAPCD